MPNWCQNNVTISHEDPEMMLKFAAAMKENKLFETFVPYPNGEWEYGWCIENWGTKWDVTDGDFNLEEDNKSGMGFFDTAWSAPIGFYEKLTEQGFDVDATYIETGMCFAGSWSSEGGEDHYDYDFEDENWRENIFNPDVLEMLEGEYEAWLEWRQEDEEYDDDTDEGVPVEGTTEGTK